MGGPRKLALDESAVLTLAVALCALRLGVRPPTVIICMIRAMTSSASTCGCLLHYSHHRLGVASHVAGQRTQRAAGVPCEGARAVRL
jgi:hypothetical protein